MTIDAKNTNLKFLSHEQPSSNLISLLTSERKLMENILLDFECFQDANDQVNHTEKVTKLIHLFN